MVQQIQAVVLVQKLPQATNNAGNGGSGVVILRYPSSATINQIGGLTLTTFTESSDKVTANYCGNRTSVLGII